ncbi:hypothetical protein BDZ94DRAFT_1262641 [Collybia nuda]|uniref:Uncharacterized protein n=1 Tax=Collybia nuda TaxID=64659 RepID=A0A9P5Y489_9AGAR|nr:hypothetical protein BDZ94DRAFT_1262641 [Collybia nuda]
MHNGIPGETMVSFVLRAAHKFARIFILWYVLGVSLSGRGIMILIVVGLGSPERAT